MAKRGELFERTIFEFYRKLDPEADVRFDHHVKDRDTEAMRQVDVWIQHRVFGNIPISILVSCKDHSRPLDVGEVETFLSEIRSTGATTGVLYGRHGFTRNAIAKAQANQVQCCRLLENEAPETPSELLIEAFVAHPVYTLLAMPSGEDVPTDLTWSIVFRCKERVGDVETPIAELLTGICIEALCIAEPNPANRLPGHGPSDVVAKYLIRDHRDFPPIALHLTLTWDWFRGRLDAYSHTGSLNVAEKHFVGSATVTLAPLHATPASSAWEPCPPPSAPQDTARITFSALACPPPNAFVAAMSHSKLCGGGPWRFGSPSAEALGSSLSGLPQCPPQSHSGISVSANFGIEQLGPHRRP